MTTNKTTALRGLIAARLQTTGGATYHLRADPAALFPHKVYALSSVKFPYGDRDDLELVVDLWDKAKDPKNLEAIADSVEALFDGVTIPAPPLYPAFFRESRFVLDDPDKTLQHMQLRFSVQLHEKEAT